MFYKIHTLQILQIITIPTSYQCEINILLDIPVTFELVFLKEMVKADQMSLIIQRDRTMAEIMGSSLCAPEDLEE